MSSGSRTVVDVSMCGAGVAPKVGYMHGSGGTAPLFHVGTISGACSDCRLLSTDFSLYSVMHATDRMAGTARGFFS